MKEQSEAKTETVYFAMFTKDSEIYRIGDYPDLEKLEEQIKKEKGIRNLQYFLYNYEK